MAFSDYSTTAASNTSIAGISIAENCPAANINNAIRQLMADAKTFSNSSPSTSGLMPKSGGAFTGSITRSGGGSYLYWSSSSLSGGICYVQTSATALPSSPAEGTVVFQY